METVPMIINKCYGGFGYSDAAFREYRARMMERNPALASKLDDKNKITSSRFDPIMIEVIRKLGKKASSKYSNLVIVDVIKEYKKYIIIDEYDGMESFHYNLSTYKLDKIREITDSLENPIAMVEKIKIVLGKELL